MLPRPQDLQLRSYREHPIRRGTFTCFVSLPPTDIVVQFQSHALGSFLRDAYLTGSGDTKIPRIDTELVNLKQVHVRVKTGSEGTAVFDSATALLQGLFPPNTKNREQLADGTVIVAPLDGYQYIPGTSLSHFIPLPLFLILYLPQSRPSSLLTISLWRVGLGAL
jgi:hypothetical protein